MESFRPHRCLPWVYKHLGERKRKNKNKIGDVDSNREYWAIMANILYHLCQPWMNVKSEVDSLGNRTLLIIAFRSSRATSHSPLCAPDSRNRQIFLETSEIGLGPSTMISHHLRVPTQTLGLFFYQAGILNLPRDLAMTYVFQTQKDQWPGLYYETGVQHNIGILHLVPTPDLNLN